MILGTGSFCDLKPCNYDSIRALMDVDSNQRTLTAQNARQICYSKLNTECSINNQDSDECQKCFIEEFERGMTMLIEARGSVTYLPEGQEANRNFSVESGTDLPMKCMAPNQVPSDNM